MNEPLTLRGLVAKSLAERNASGRELARLAESRGFKITFTTLNAIAAGTYKSRPSDETVRAIAWLAGVSNEVAFRAAGLRVPGPPFADELPPGVDNLSPEARKAVIGILRVLVQQEEVIGDARDAAPTNPAAGSTPAGGAPDLQHAEHVADALTSDRYDLAARRGEPGNPPDTTTGEENQDAGGAEPA